MKYILSSLVLLSITACSSSPYKKLESEYKEGDISLNALQNLARASYLKGCTENSKLKFKECSEKAQKHVEEITKILK